LSPELLLLAQICTKSFVGCGFAPDPLRELTVLLRPPSWFRGWGPQGKGRREGGEGRGGSPGVPELASLHYIDFLT